MQFYHSNPEILRFSLIAVSELQGSYKVPHSAKFLRNL